MFCHLVVAAAVYRVVTDSSLVRSHFLLPSYAGLIEVEDGAAAVAAAVPGTWLTVQFFILIGGDTSKVAE